MITNISIDPAYICNENCISCKCDKLSEVFANLNKLSLDEYYQLIDDFVLYGGKSVSVYGGEPLLSVGVFSILKYAKTKGLITSITTNGILFNNVNILSNIKECKPDQIVISVMAAGEMYGKLHGKDYFELFVEGVKKILFLQEKKVSDISFHMTLQKANFNQLPSIVLLARQLGIKKVSFQYVSTITDEVNDRTEKILGATFNNVMCHWNIGRQVLLADDEIGDCIDSVHKAIEMADSFGISLDVDPIFYEKNIEEILSTGCFGARRKCDMNSIIVLPNGLIGACSMLQHYIVGDIKKQTIKEIISGEAFENVRKRVENGVFLSICDYCCRHSMFFGEDE